MDTAVIYEDRRTDVTKLTSAFTNRTNVPNKRFSRLCERAAERSWRSMALDRYKLLG